MAEGAGSGERFVPARYQPPLPRERLILPQDAPGAGDRMELDVLIVGAGPAGLAAAIGLAGLLVDGELVVGVRTAATGLDRDGKRLPSYQAPNDIVAKVTALAEGTRGMLAQAWLEWQGVPSENPQIFALGVKEIWETQRPLDRVIHTLGWPLPTDAFGGSFLYPLEPNLLALGLVVGLDYRSAALDVHVLPQRLRLHPLVRRYLVGGQALDWGAMASPEGGS